MDRTFTAVFSAVITNDFGAVRDSGGIRLKLIAGSVLLGLVWEVFG